MGLFTFLTESLLFYFVMTSFPVFERLQKQTFKIKGEAKFPIGAAGCYHFSHDDPTKIGQKKKLLQSTKLFFSTSESTTTEELLQLKECQRWS